MTAVQDSNEVLAIPSNFPAKARLARQTKDTEPAQQTILAYHISKAMSDRNAGHRSALIPNEPSTGPMSPWWIKLGLYTRGEDPSATCLSRCKSRRRTSLLSAQWTASHWSLSADSDFVPSRRPGRPRRLVRSRRISTGRFDFTANQRYYTVLPGNCPRNAQLSTVD